MGSWQYLKTETRWASLLRYANRIYKTAPTFNNLWLNLALARYMMSFLINVGYKQTWFWYWNLYFFQLSVESNTALPERLNDQSRSGNEKCWSLKLKQPKCSTSFGFTRTILERLFLFLGTFVLFFFFFPQIRVLSLYNGSFKSSTVLVCEMLRDLKSRL